MDDAQHMTLLVHTLARLDPGSPLASRLCRACVQVLGVHGGALTFAPTGLDRVSASTEDLLTRRLEDLQEVLGEGPGRTAFAEGRIVRTRLDGGAGDRDDFSTAVLSAAAPAWPVTIVAVPVRSHGRVLAVLTLYDTTGTLAEHGNRVQLLADVVGAMLLGSRASFDETWPDDGNRHRAIGMVIAQLRVGPADALAVLRARALAQTSSLESVVEEVLERRLTFTPDDVT